MALKCSQIGGFPNINLEDPNLTLGARIKALRVKIGLNQANLAKSTGLATSIIGRYEQGRILDLNPFVLEKIATTLKVTPLELLPPAARVGIKDSYDYFCRSDTRGSKIKKLRLKHHLQQKDLARMLGIHKVSLCRYEKNHSKPDSIIIQKLKEIFKSR
ncbi:MAG: helix-turn-helix transcriptional regulator [Elusimicrobiota bacterium]